EDDPAALPGGTAAVLGQRAGAGPPARRRAGLLARGRPGRRRARLVSGADRAGAPGPDARGARPRAAGAGGGLGAVRAGRLRGPGPVVPVHRAAPAALPGHGAAAAEPGAAAGRAGARARRGLPEAARRATRRVRRGRRRGGDGDARPGVLRGRPPRRPGGRRVNGTAEIRAFLRARDRRRRPWSDRYMAVMGAGLLVVLAAPVVDRAVSALPRDVDPARAGAGDRKSTRLNSSHVKIS